MTVEFVRCEATDTKRIKKFLNWQGPLPAREDYVTISDDDEHSKVNDVEWDLSRSPVLVRVWLR